MQDENLTGQIIGAAMRVHNTLGPGFLESVYQDALAHELQKLGLTLERGKHIHVHYDGVVVGDFCADMLVEHRILMRTRQFAR